MAVVILFLFLLRKSKFNNDDIYENARKESAVRMISIFVEYFTAIVRFIALHGTDIFSPPGQFLNEESWHRSCASFLFRERKIYV